MSAVLLAVAIEHLRVEVVSRLPGTGQAANAWAQANLGQMIPAGYSGLPAAGGAGLSNVAGNMGGYGAYSNVPQGASVANPNIPSSYGPSPPAPPRDATRPASWPGGPGDGANVPPPAPPPTGPPLMARKDPLESPIEPASILAHVGSEVVQASEILPAVHQTLDGFVAKLGKEFDQLPEDAKKEQLKKWERELAVKTLNDVINLKLLISDLKSAVPAEQVNKNMDRVRREFNEHEIKRLMGVYKASSVVDLDNKLRAHGGSLDTQRIVFVERYMAIGWLRQQIKEQHEPSHEDMINYYREHMADWERPARARWEELTANFDQFPSKEAAKEALMQWGNAVWYGTPFGDVAKAHSQGFSAEEGGLNDWTTQGSLRSEAIDQALFGLPVGALSQIIEDDEGCHIVRVVEREDRRTVPFLEVQADIKQKLEEGDQQDQMTAYVEKLRERMPVETAWTTTTPRLPIGKLPSADSTPLAAFDAPSIPAILSATCSGPPSAPPAHPRQLCAANSTDTLRHSGGLG